MGVVKELHWLSEEQILVTEPWNSQHVLLLASVGSAYIGSESDQDQFNSWAGAKAMESCWGEENNKKYIVTVKKAKAKCGQEDAPELELPPYRSMYRLVNLLTSSAERQEMEKMEQVFNMMKHLHQQEKHGFAPYTDSRDELMEKMMMKYTMKQMMKKFMSNEYQTEQSYIPYSADNNKYNYGMLRSKRDATDTIDLGDKLIGKLNAQIESLEAERGNLTCILKELGMINADNEIDVSSMKNKLKEYDIPTDWFKNRFEDLIDVCYEMANNLPENIADQYPTTYGRTYVHTFGQIKQFLKCYHAHHVRLCMDQDCKEKIESNYGPLTDIMDQTQLTEQQLFRAFRQIHSEDSFFEF